MRISRKSKTRLLTTVGGLCCLFGSIGVGAQQTEPLPVGSALNVTSFGQLVPIEFSPDGKWLAYTVQENLRSKSADFEALARTGVPVWGEGTDINISSVESGQARNLTGGKGNNWLPAWSPNGAYLAFFSDRDGSGHARVWVWDVANDELKKISNVEVRGNEIKWTPDSRRVLVTAIPQGISVDEYARITSSPRDDDRAASTETPGSRVYVYQSGGSSGQKRPMSDPWNLDWVIRDLVSIEVATGKALPLVHLKRIEEYRLSPDGSRLAFTLPKRFEKPGSQQILFDLVMVNLATQQERVVASDIRLDYDGASFSWSPDGIHLSFQLGGVEEQVRDCYVVDLKDGASHNVSALPMPRLGSPYRSWAPLWDRKGEYVYYIHDGALWRSSLSQSKGKEIAHVPNRQILKVVAQSENVLWAPGDGKSAIVLTIDQLGKQDGFYQLDLDGRTIAKLLEKGECYTCANVVRGEFTAVARDGRKVAYMAEDAVHDRDLWMGDSTFRNTRRWTHLNPQFDRITMGSVRLIEWLSYDGERLQGALLLPPDFREGKRYPVVVSIYGGASLSDRFDRFGLGLAGPFNLQLLATRGYAVLVPDAPQHLGTPMFDIGKTVLPGVNKLIEMGVADPNRIGVMGQSLGGYSTLALVVQTRRFKAAIDVDGFGDLTSAYGEMMKDGTAFGTSVMEQTLIGGPPWQFRDRFTDNSPIFYLDKIETPLLIIHGSEDTTVAPFLGDEVFVGLRRLGREVEYAKYEGEGHSPLYWSYANQVDFCKRMINWLDVHLKPDIVR